FQSLQGTVRDAVKSATDAGYCHFDCACPYPDKSEIGDALRKKIEEGVARREDLFIISKLWATFHKRSPVKESGQKTLAAFQLDYLDLSLSDFSTYDSAYLKLAFLLISQAGKELFPAGGNGMIIPNDTDFLDTWE
ncbi:AKCL2 reductase, partial [Eurystomus gularis]|nr:AKCL2 reductase [Eurystomus gularis]